MMWWRGSAAGPSAFRCSAVAGDQRGLLAAEAGVAFSSEARG